MTRIRDPGVLPLLNLPPPPVLAEVGAVRVVVASAAAQVHSTARAHTHTHLHIAFAEDILPLISSVHTRTHAYHHRELGFKI